MNSSRWLPFLRYAVAGGLNTALHWLVFALLVWRGNPQSLSNLCAFLVAVTFSFFLNAQWTFRARASIKRYVTMVLTMGTLSFILGAFADALSLHPIVTMVGFSVLSLVIGYLIARFIVFREVP